VTWFWSCSRIPLGQLVTPKSDEGGREFFSGIQFGMDDWGERELSQLAADGRRLTLGIAGWLVCADALRLGTSRAPAKTPARRTKLGDDGNPQETT